MNVHFRARDRESFYTHVCYMIVYVRRGDVELFCSWPRYYQPVRTMYPNSLGAKLHHIARLIVIVHCVHVNFPSRHREYCYSHQRVCMFRHYPDTVILVCFVLGLGSPGRTCFLK